MSSETTKTEQKVIQTIQVQNEDFPIKLGSHKGNNPMKTADPKANQESPLIYAQVANQTLEATVNKLNALALDNWVGLGKEINDYIHNASNSSAKTDKFKELADHKDSPFKDSQLRNYVSGFLVWQMVGGRESAPALSLGHYLVVVPKRVTALKKRFYLIYAKEHDLTASQFREYIEKEYKLIPDLKKYLGKSLIKLQERISDIYCREIIKHDPEMTRTLRLTIAQIFAQKLLRLEEISMVEME